jgi:hypothetical protein
VPTLLRHGPAKNEYTLLLSSPRRLPTMRRTDSGGLAQC